MFAFDVGDDEDPFSRLVALVGEELILEFEAAKSTLGQAKQRAQLAVTTLLSAARPAQDALLRLEALAAEGPWPTAAWAIGLKRKAADREEAELNDLHQAEIALARANVVKCHIAVSLKHKAVLAEISEQRAEFEAELEATAATDRRIAAAMVRPGWAARRSCGQALIFPGAELSEPESEEPTDSSDSSDAESSSEETSWELAAGGLSTAAAAEERWSRASLESTDFSEAEQGSTDPSDDYSEEEWEDFRKRMGWNEDLTWEEWQDLQTRQDAVAAAEAAATTTEEAAAAALAAAALATEMEAAMTSSVDAAGPGNGNAQSRRLERRAAERRRQQEAVEMAAALEEPFEEPADFWASMEAAVDAVAAASAVEEATTVAEHLDSVQIRDITLTERRQAAQEGLRRAGLLPGGQGGRGEMEAGGRPLSFDRGK